MHNPWNSRAVPPRENFCHPPLSAQDLHSLFEVSHKKSFTCLICWSQWFGWSFIQNKLNLSQLIHDRIYCFVLAQVFIPCLIHFKSEYFRVGKRVLFIICECFMKKGVSKLVNFKMYLVEFIYTGY